MIPSCPLTNTEVLCFVIGWQGGTLAELALALCVPGEMIQTADREKMQELCRRAQVYNRFHTGKRGEQ